MGEKLDFITLALASNAELEEYMKRGIAPDVRKLVGWRFKGYNTLDVTTILGFRKFKKGFFSKEPPPHEGAPIWGYNVDVKQNGLVDPWIEKGKPPYGFYRVYRVDPASRDNLYPNALLLDYGQGGNPPYDPSRFLRDYLVQVDPDNPDLLLGKAYVALGPVRVFVSFFVLERLDQSDFVRS